MKITLKLFLPILAVAMLVSCKKDKTEKASVGEAQEVAKVDSGKTYAVNTTTSKVLWTGTKPAGSHTGTIGLSNGSLTVKDGNISAGAFTIDMNSINCTDLEGDGKASIEAHLKGTRSDDEADDFFNVAKFPTAKFEITKVTKLVNNPDATHLVYGNLTMKGVTKEVGIKSKVDISDSGISVTAPEFGINRTDWGITFMSKNFIEGLKDKFINDEIKLSIDLSAS